MQPQEATLTRSFTTIREIGRGTFSKVLLTSDMKALKTLSSPASSHDQTIFLNDVNTCIRVGDHPHIVKHIDFIRGPLLINGQIETTDCQISETCEGGELSYHLLMHGATNFSTARCFLKQLISAVSFLHSELKVVHRDLKPWNILLDKSTTKLKVIDFGLSTPIDYLNAPEPFCSKLKSTKNYMAPEILIQNES